MKKLPFTLPVEWTRVIWSSNPAREVWEPRIQRITAAWENVERLSVVDGVRPSCLQSVSPERLAEVSAWAAQRGLVLLPLRQAGTSAQYAATGQPYETGKPWEYRVAITRPELAFAWHRAWRESADDRIGQLLGFPACCRRFFQRVWIEEKGLDTSWQMAGGPAAEGAETLREIRTSPAESNILLRWIGVRLVSHLPCSFACEASAALGRAMAEVGIAHGYGEEIAWAREMLSWPVEWSALHGIAEIKTPILKVSTRTDATPCKYTVQLVGTSYPELGARGLRFPYRARPRSLAPVIPLRDTWTDNGFSSWAAMREAHAVVLEAAKAARGVRSVLDLGCGNGQLLAQLARMWPRAVPHGVDVDEAKIARARQLMRQGVFTTGSVEEALSAAEDYDLALVMPGRIVEMDVRIAAAFRARLDERAGQVLVYAYGDWLPRYGGLEALTRAAGLPWAPVSHLKKERVAEAALLGPGLAQVPAVQRLDLPSQGYRIQRNIDGVTSRRANSETLTLTY